MAYDNTNSGALFKNDKEGNEKRPDYKGKLNVDGVEYRISSWLKTSASGMKFMSLSVEPMQDGPPAAKAPTPAAAPTGKYVEVEDENDDIPF